MERIVKIGIVQCSTPKTTGTFDEIRGAMIEKHLGLIKKAYESGVKILGLQEVFNGNGSRLSSFLLGEGLKFC